MRGHEDNFKAYQRSDFLASRLEVKWSLLIYWARRCKAIYMTLKEHFETEKSNHLHQVLNIQLAGVKIQVTCM